MRRVLVSVAWAGLIAACEGEGAAVMTMDSPTLAGSIAPAAGGAGASASVAGTNAPIATIGGNSGASAVTAGSSGIAMSGSGATPTAAGRGGASGRMAPNLAGRGGAGSIAQGSTAGIASNAGGTGGRAAAGTGAAGAAAAGTGTGAAGRSSPPGNGNAVVMCATPIGNVTYTLSKAAMPSTAEQQTYAKITAAMDVAVSYYNCYTNITKRVMVSYNPDVATADGSTNGSIRFGAQSSINHITAMHELGHTAGVGSAQWGAMIVNGIFPGKNATAQLVEITGNAQDQVHGDKQHFWPYGLNYTTEVKSADDLIAHCKMVVAIRKDLGL